MNSRTFSGAHSDATYSLCIRELVLMQYTWVTGKKVEYFFTQKLPKTMAVKRKKDLQLECMLSDPRPHVTWYKNGEKIEVTIVSEHHDILKSGSKTGVTLFAGLCM